MKTKLSALWPDDISDAIDLGYIAAVCFYNNPAGNVRKYVADACDTVLMNRAESHAADGLSRREITRMIDVGRGQFMATVREAYKDAAGQLKKFKADGRLAMLVYRNYLSDSREIYSFPAEKFDRNSNSEAIRCQFLRQEKFDATK